MKTFWTISGSILFAGMISWGGYNAITLVGHESYREDLTYDASAVRSVDVSNSAGSVRITGTASATESGQIRLTAEVTDGLRKTENRHEIVDEVLVVRASCPKFGSTWCKVTYTLEVPYSMAAKVRTENDAIHINELAGPVDAGADNGSVNLGGLSGDLVIQSDNGSIRGEGLTSPTVRVDADNGDVRMRFDAPPTSVDASTDNGDVTVEVPRPDSYNVDSSTDNGSVSIDVVDDPTSARTIDISTDNGDATIRYADG